MRLVQTEKVIGRLQQLAQEIYEVDREFLYYDRLRAFRNYCRNTPSLSHCLEELPRELYDFDARVETMSEWLPEEDHGYGMRWNAIDRVVERGSEGLHCLATQLAGRESIALSRVTQVFVIPLYNYLISQIQSSSTMTYILLRYKRWAEWFAVEQLRGMYAADTQRGETALDQDLRRFLFESGIDYPFSQPDSPGGRADIVAQLDTDDPLVLEVKIWDSEKSYKENRVHDGLRQVMDYADKYGKDRGYVVVFNLDQHPLDFVSPMNTDEWPPWMEVGGKTYYFIDINIGEQPQSVSERDKGKPVETQRVVLVDLLRQSPDD